MPLAFIALTGSRKDRMYTQTTFDRSAFGWAPRTCEAQKCIW